MGVVRCTCTIEPICKLAIRGCFVLLHIQAAVLYTLLCTVCVRLSGTYDGIRAAGEIIQNLLGLFFELAGIVY